MDLLGRAVDHGDQQLMPGASLAQRHTLRSSPPAQHRVGAGEVAAQLIELGERDMVGLPMRPIATNRHVA